MSIRIFEKVLLIQKVSRRSYSCGGKNAKNTKTCANVNAKLSFNAYGDGRVDVKSEHS